MGRFNVDRYEAGFVVDERPEEVWTRLEVVEGGQPLWLSAWPRMPGFETTGEVVDAQAPERIRALKHSEPCRDSEIMLTLTPHSGGTEIKVEQANLPAWVQGAVDVFVLGGDQITADLALYLTRGVVVCRHAMRWAFSGVMVREVETGLEVTDVMPGCYGERVGLEPGDLLLTVAGAPVFTQACLQALMRVLETGAETDCTFVRGSEIREASGVL